MSFCGGINSAIFAIRASGTLTEAFFENPAHVYTMPGDYSIRLTVTDSTLGSFTATKRNLIHVEAGLVAGFDVFGNVTHQVSTRLYMDHLRMQSEVLYLDFLPAERRMQIRASWYVGATKEHTFKIDHTRVISHGTQIAFRTSNPHAEFIDLVLKRDAAIAGPPDLLNRCRGDACDRPGASSVERQADAALRPLTRVGR